MFSQRVEVNSLQLAVKLHHLAIQRGNSNYSNSAEAAQFNNFMLNFFFFCSYKNNIECEWTIKASPGNQMVLNIVMLDIDETATCNGDYLEIRETNSVGKILGVYCGSNIPSTLPTANTYWLKFRSDNDGVGNGFRAEYSYGKSLNDLTASFP